MNPIILLSLLLQIACCVHVVHSDMLLIFSHIGMLVYLIAGILPGLRNNHGSRQVMRNVRNALDPQREKRNASRRLDFPDTPENRRRLAAKSLDSGITRMRWNSTARRSKACTPPIRT